MLTIKHKDTGRILYTSPSEDCKGLVFQQLDLRGANFYGQKLEYPRFVDCNLAGACFREADLRTAVFELSQLDETGFQGALLCKSMFIKTEGCQTNFYGASLTGSRLMHAIFQKPSFRRANLNEVIANYSDFTGGDFSYVQAQDAEFDSCEFSEVVFRRGFLDRSELTRSSFYKANFRGANLPYTDLSYANLSEADFTASRLLFANFSDVTFGPLECFQPSWGSHDLLSAVLRSKAKTLNEKMVAAYILRVRGNCWSNFLKMDHPSKCWAVKVLDTLNKNSMSNHLAAALDDTLISLT